MMQVVRVLGAFLGVIVALVEGGSQDLDRELEVTVTRVLQTVARRMVFAQPRHG